MKPKATYTKLKQGDWGIRVEGPVTAGQTVTVTKKNGESKQEVIAKIIWQGNGICLCLARLRQHVYDPDKFNGYGAPRGGSRRACCSGGNCSSFGNGRSCGGYDCDGF